MKLKPHLSGNDHGRARCAGVCVAFLLVNAAVPIANANPNRSTKMTTDTTTDAGSENKKKIEKLFDTFNHDDLRPLDELVSADYVGAQGDRGPAGFRSVTIGLRSAFPDLHYTLDDLMAEHDKVAVRWHWTGTHRGAFRNHAATGKAVSNHGIAIFRFQDGKIVAASLETDRLGFLQQIGAVPENVGLGAGPGPAGAKVEGTSSVPAK